MALTVEQWLGAVSFLMSLAGSAVYIRSVLMGKTKPHFYTWFVFSILTAIAFLAQISDKAGPGSWMMGATVVSCTSIALLSLKYGEKSRNAADKIALAASLFAIVPWLLTKDPLLSVVMISLIDAVAMFPTIRKSWHKPDQENLSSYWIAIAKNVLALFALTNFTLVTSLYLISICFINATLIFVCLYRQRTYRL